MIIFRVDGNSEIGIGHVMRCLTIASFISKEEDILFVCCNVETAQYIRQREYKVSIMPTNYKKLEEEIEEITTLIRSIRDKVTILVDTYFVTESYLASLMKVANVFLLDDLAACKYPVTGMINYNIYASQEMYDKIDSNYPNNYYLGAAYIPIRKDFLGEKYEVKDVVQNIMITTGGADNYNITNVVLNAIYTSSTTFHIIIGKYNKNYDTILQNWGHISNINIYYDIQDMASIMKKMDIIITAGGTTLYEVCALGVPCICFSYAENQNQLVQYMGDCQIAEYAGRYHEDKDKVIRNIKEGLERLVGDFSLRQAYSNRQKEVVDGIGAKRIAMILEKTYEMDQEE